MGFYVESADRPYTSSIAAEDIHVGTLVHEDGSEDYELLNKSDHDEFDALATAPRRGDYIADEEDESSDFTYSSSDDDRVPALPLADRDIVKARTAKDAGGNEAKPSISNGDVVGVIDTSAGTLSSTSEYEGRVVEEGYTDGEGTPTTYNRSNGNFLPIGKALRDDAREYDVPVRIQVDRGL